MRRLGLLLASVFVVGCFVPDIDPYEGICDEFHLCPEGRYCVAKRCVVDPPPLVVDAGSDAGARDAGAPDAGDGGSDAGNVDAGTPDGSVPVTSAWLQWVHGFDSTERCATCTVNVETRDGNQLTATITGSADTNDFAYGVVERLPRTLEGTLAGEVRVVPMPAWPILSPARFAFVTSDGGQRLMSLEFSEEQEIGAFTDPFVLSPPGQSAFTPYDTVEAGVRYRVVTRWRQNELWDFQVLDSQGAELHRTTRTTDGGFTNELQFPGRLQLGIVDYAHLRLLLADGGMQTIPLTQGWTVTLFNWQLHDSAQATPLFP